MMEIKDLSWKNDKPTRKNNELLPKSIRGLIVGKSGCGKTTLLMNLLLRWLDYNKLFVFGKSLFQKEYQILKRAIEEGLPKEMITLLFQDKIESDPFRVIEELSECIKKKSDIECEFCEDGVPDPEELDSNDNNLMIFDDLMLEKQNSCEKYYTRGRHSNVDCFYLSQNYFKLPRQTVRENTNFICLFPQDNKNITHIFQDHVSSDMTLDRFKYLCKEAWKEPHGFVVIDLTSKHGRYRCNFDKFYII